ncbi:MAG TPA: hypothetical protein DDZ88_28360, partial [Verrucomicrobiales bacterium]|nr:hypothetical protein [Verrucomicrobiales bacterium]
MKTLRQHHKLLGWFMICLMAVWLPGNNLRAATFYWDSDGFITGNDATTGDGLGGDGVWDLSSAFWWDGDASMGAWNNSFNDVAIFAGTAGIVTLADLVSAGGLTFNSRGSTITGSTLTLGAPAGSNSPVINVGLMNSATISSLLAGTQGFTKTGNGALVLANAANTFTGDISIKQGSLVISNAWQLGSGNTAISVTGIANTGNPGFSGGQLVLNGIDGGVIMTRDISVSGRGPGAVNSSGGLVSVGNNVLNGNLVIASGASEGRVTATHGITTVNGGVQLGAGAAQLFYGNGNWIINGRVTG